MGMFRLPRERSRMKSSSKAAVRKIQIREFFEDINNWQQ
jgi:hypothetical protein